MDVASKALCQELSALSGWDDCLWHHPGRESSHSLNNLYWKKTEDSIPAYDLGFLLRKLPVFSQIYKDSGGEYRASLSLGTGKPKYFAATPENAAAKLAIELLKQGILTSEHNASSELAQKPQKGIK